MEMWVEELKNGKFKMVERYTDYLTGKVHRVSVTMDKSTSQSRKIAQQALDAKIDKAMTNSDKPKENYTFRDLVAAYRADQERTVKQSTYTRNYHSANTLMRMIGKDVLINRLDTGYVRSHFLATGKKAGTLNEHRKRFVAIIRWGYDNNYIDNIEFLEKFKTFKDPEPVRARIQDKYLEAYQLKKLLNNMDDPVWRAFTQFLALSGLRCGEAIALHKKDVDFENNVIHITKTFDPVNKVVNTPKTLCSIRDIYMQPELVKVCRTINALMLRRQLMCGIGRTDLFVFSQKGTHINYYTYNKYIKKYSVFYIKKEITPHVLRHTHASLLLENGVSIDAITRRLGHENSDITRKIYLHLTQKLDERDRDMIGKVNIL